MFNHIHQMAPIVNAELQLPTVWLALARLCVGRAHARLCHASSYHCHYYYRYRYHYHNNNYYSLFITPSVAKILMVKNR